MIQTRLFAHDPVMNVTKWWHYDDAEDVAWIETINNDAPVLMEQNAESRKYDTGRFHDGMHKVASIPLHIFMDLKQRGILDDQKAMRRWWASDDALPWKTRHVCL